MTAGESKSKYNYKFKFKGLFLCTGDVLFY